MARAVTPALDPRHRWIGRSQLSVPHLLDALRQQVALAQPSHGGTATSLAELRSRWCPLPIDRADDLNAADLAVAKAKTNVVAGRDRAYSSSPAVQAHGPLRKLFILAGASQNAHMTVIAINVP